MTIIIHSTFEGKRFAGNDAAEVVRNMGPGAGAPDGQVEIYMRATARRVIETTGTSTNIPVQDPEEFLLALAQIGLIEIEAWPGVAPQCFE